MSFFVKLAISLFSLQVLITQALPSAEPRTDDITICGFEGNALKETFVAARCSKSMAQPMGVPAFPRMGLARFDIGVATFVNFGVCLANEIVVYRSDETHCEHTVGGSGDEAFTQNPFDATY
ncbi:hypothetical protein EV361DRAFT_874385 [Lentinula raphanica]|nr:hypothetical protein EV361DRAFT_874385 [Lentinula raphanica]